MILPLWQFGKTRMTDGAQRGSYVVLASSPEFSDEQQAILHRITESTSWRPRDGSACAPVLACWPLGGDDWLLLRFIDDGVDDHHRPNTMRMEAALAKNMLWERVRELLTLEAWPAPASDGAISIDLVPYPRIDETTPKPSAPILLAGTDELTATLFEMHSDAKMQENQSNTQGYSAPQLSLLMQTSSTDSSERKSLLKWFVAILAIIICGAAVIIAEQYSEIKGLIKKNETLSSEISDNQKYVDELKRDITGRDGIISRLEDENKNLQIKTLDVLPENLRIQQETVMKSLQQAQNSLETFIQNLSDTEGDMNIFKANLRKAVEDGMKQEKEQESLSHGNALPSTSAPAE